MVGLDGHIVKFFFFFFFFCFFIKGRQDTHGDDAWDLAEPEVRDAVRGACASSLWAISAMAWYSSGLHIRQCRTAGSLMLLLLLRRFHALRSKRIGRARAKSLGGCR